jgi:D-galactarolactone cycloisomerase
LKITEIRAIPFIAERRTEATGTAGSPAKLQSAVTSDASHYRWAENYPVLYSTRFEAALIRITLDSGLVGWGESQAPLAPEVACTIVDRILKPVLIGSEFEGRIAEIESLWWRMYSAMRVRGQTGGFMLDAIAGVDLALWDLAGKIAGKPVSNLISATSRSSVPAYLSGLPSGSAAGVRPWLDAGFSRVKIFHDASEERLFENVDAIRAMLPASGGLAVDALWRLTPLSAPAFAAKLESRDALWLEAPLPPESAPDHAALARSTQVPIAIGESYRTVFELQPFFDVCAMKIVQPDLGRTGITEALRTARTAKERGMQVIPHVSIAMGPQIAAAIHFAAAISNCPMLEFNPNVIETANRYLAVPMRVKDAHYQLPEAAGLGLEIVNL